MGVGTCVLHSPLPSPPPPRIIHKAIKWLRNLRYTHRQVLSVSTTAVSIYSVGVSITVSQSGSPLIVPQRVVFCGMLPTWIHERWETLTQMRTVNRFNVGLKVDHVQSSGWGVFPKGTLPFWERLSPVSCLEWGPISQTAAGTQRSNESYTYGHRLFFARLALVSSAEL